MVESLLVLALTYSQPKWDDVIKPQLERRDEQIRAIEASKKALEVKVVQSTVNEVKPLKTTVNASYGELQGTLGYALPYGNCVNEPGVNRTFGNPSSWPSLYSEPHIGATFMFWGNHTGIVTGIWSNGDVEVRHQNFYANVHRFPRSMFRGYR